jgi:uncharacterized protein YecE (DUF72 family)
MPPDKYLVGTSGYSFDDWVGPFYQPGTRRNEMFQAYVQAFETVELNYTFYRMPSARTLESLARRSPPAFSFWVKANQRTTHKQDRSAGPPFLEHIVPLAEAGKLAGVLLQFPQSFHRTIANRKYLAECLTDLAGPALAVEFRHCSWQHPSVVEGLRQRDVTLVIPDVPPIGALYQSPPLVTNAVGYLRLHSRTADLWYAGAVERYDYDYSDAELRDLLGQWSQVENEVEKVFAFFNNCHRAQAAANAEAFRRILGQID